MVDRYIRCSTASVEVEGVQLRLIDVPPVLGTSAADTLVGADGGLLIGIAEASLEFALSLVPSYARTT